MTVKLLRRKSNLVANFAGANPSHGMIVCLKKSASCCRDTSTVIQRQSERRVQSVLLVRRACDEFAQFAQPQN